MTILIPSRLLKTWSASRFLLARAAFQRIPAPQRPSLKTPRCSLRLVFCFNIRFRRTLGFVRLLLSDSACAASFYSATVPHPLQPDYGPQAWKSRDNRVCQFHYAAPHQRLGQSSFFRKLLEVSWRDFIPSQDDTNVMQM